MSTSVEKQLDRLSALCTVVDELRAAVNRTERLRDDYIRELRSDGVRAAQLVEATRLGRARLYNIVGAPSSEADDDAQMEWGQKFDDVWEYALDKWLNNDEQGHPDDYIPLEALFERR